MTRAPAFDAQAMAPTLNAHARTLRARLLVGWLVVSVVVLGGAAVLQQRLIKQEERHWTQQLEVGSMRRAQTVYDLSRKQVALLENVANNVSVQLYLAQVQAMPVDAAGASLPERQYLENLMIATANRAGFVSPSLASGEVGAALPATVPAGMALLDAKNAMVAATRGMPPLKDALARFLASASPLNASVSAPVHLAEDVYGVYMQAPIYSVQSEPAAENMIGRVLAVRVLDAALLKPVLQMDQTRVNTYLVPSATDKQLLSMDNGSLLSQPLTGNAGVELRAIQKPGHWISDTDRHNDAAYAMAVPVEGSSMMVLQTITRSDALHEVRQQLVWVWVAALLSVVGAGVLVWALVRHSVALRASMSATHFQTLAADLANTGGLLQLVLDNTPNHITIIDDKGRICFSNRTGEQSLNAVQGKSLAALLGKDVAHTMWSHCEDVLERGAVVVSEDARETSRGERHFRSMYMPLKTIPVDLPFLQEKSKGILIVEEDITELEAERAERENTLNAIVDCLVGVVDARDPFAAQHSHHVAQLAESVAAALGLDAQQQETAVLAAKLLNVGKIHVPESVLTRAASLDADALATIREALRSSADLVDGIAFRGPVADTLRQSLEQMDGSGPMGLKGDAILLPARIVAVANAYVGMTSERAYRAKLSHQDASAQLMRLAGQCYDPAVVAALVHKVSLHG